VLYLQVYVSQEAETFTVHSLFTIQNTEAIKWNKECAKTAGFRSAGHICNCRVHYRLLEYHMYGMAVLRIYRDYEDFN